MVQAAEQEVCRAILQRIYGVILPRVQREAWMRVCRSRLTE